MIYGKIRSDMIYDMIYDMIWCDVIWYITSLDLKFEGKLTADIYETLVPAFLESVDILLHETLVTVVLETIDIYETRATVVLETIGVSETRVPSVI